jgi:hypothetical protein
MLSLQELEAVRAALLRPTAATTARAIALIDEAAQIEKELADMKAAGAFKSCAAYARYSASKAATARQ